MHKTVLTWLRCPADYGVLRLIHQQEAPDGHVMEGKLECTECGLQYPIRHGVPDLLPHSLDKENNNELQAIQKATIDRFGFEWQHFQDWGWLPDYPNVPEATERFYGGLQEHSRSAFWSKTLFHQSDLREEHLILDAGCGNGRFTNEAAKTGANIISIDLGWGVYSAFEHMRSSANVHVVRGDLLQLPFAESTFDRVFSIGVLMHTGDAEGAFISIARTVKSQGLFAAHVYGKGLPVYEFTDSAIRAAITRLNKENQMKFARAMARWARWLRRGRLRRKLYRYIFCVVNLLPTDIHMFDWWAAPVASHHTPDQVLAWCQQNHFQIIRNKPNFAEASVERSRRRVHAALTVLGQKRD